MSLKENSEFWDHRSQIFDGQVAKTYEEAYEKTINYTLKYVRSTDRVLDVGCGTGITTLPIAGHAGHVTAVDTSPEMLRRAREKAGQSGVENVEFYLGDLSLEELKPETFDVITVFNVLLYLPDQHGSMERIRQLLKPAGRLAVAADCLKYSFTGEARKKWWRSRTGKMPFVKFYTPRELEKLAKAHGFKILEAESLFKHPVNHFFVAQKMGSESGIR